MSERLQNKVALVTGSSSGIGAAIAKRFAREGAAIVAHGRADADAASVVEDIRSFGARAESAWGDLTDSNVCRTVVDETVRRFGRIDILVNNAAFISRGDLEQTSQELFDATMAVNARAPMLLTQAALPHFRRQSSGAVLNIGSVNSYCGEKSQLAYSMSKGALMSMSRNLADALGPEHIRVNHINPGWILTENELDIQMRQGKPADWPSKLSKISAPSGRLLLPDEIAAFAVSFVEDAGGFVTGAVVELEQYPMIGRNPPK